MRPCLQSRFWLLLCDWSPTVLGSAQGWCPDEASGILELGKGDQSAVAYGSTSTKPSTGDASSDVDSLGFTSPPDVWVDPSEWDPETFQEWSLFLKKAKLNKVCCDAFLPSCPTAAVFTLLSLCPSYRVLLPPNDSAGTTLKNDI